MSRPWASDTELVLVVDRVDLGQVAFVGRRRPAWSCRATVRWAGGDDHHDEPTRKSTRDRLAAGIDEPRLGGAAGLEPDGDRSAGRRLAREVDGRAQLALRVEEVDGDLGIGVEPVQLEAAVAAPCRG